jgi:FOG: CheY-like receiver
MQSNKIVLVAEDDGFSQMAVKMILGSLKVNFSLVDNGEAVYDAYVSKKNQVSLILMDLHMPKLDGFEAAKKIRSFERSNGIGPVRIVALSAGTFCIELLICR